MQKERQKKEEEKEEEEEEVAFPQTTLERRKKVQERKNLLSPKMPRREQPASPTRTQATLKDESEEVKRLMARVKELELVSVHRRTHTRTHTNTRTRASICTPCP